ncbi:NosD domain-containing protein [Pseudochryseolinea flava]|uniref:NosD domain-containing protein n=1 Tax=Pseudochryseolinea flava TaxID=2059302 RepID=UPI001401FE3B|nr:NosD domain-containing protein [Pseudochryseolinea flava]
MKTLLSAAGMVAFMFWSSVSSYAVTRYLAAGSSDQTVAFQNLVNESVSGDIIIVRAGDHFLSGTVNVNKNGIIVRGENGNVIRKSGNVSCIDVSGNNITIDNLYIDGGNRPEPCARVFGDYNLILNSTFRNSGNSGLLLHECHHNTIQGCKAFYNHMVGISQWAHSEGVVRDCQMYENGAEGLTIDGATHNNRVFNNWIHRNNLPHRGVGGIGVDASNGAWIYNNTIDFNGMSGITLQNNLCCGIDGMRVYDNPNISYNQECAVMHRTVQPITNFGFWNNNCVGNPNGVQCSRNFRTATHSEENVEVAEDDAIELYPNPVGNDLRISNTSGVKEAILFGNAGLLLFHQKADNAPSMTLNMSSMPKGFYVLKLKKTDGSTLTKKFIKE